MTGLAREHSEMFFCKDALGLFFSGFVFVVPISERRCLSLTQAAHDYSATGLHAQCATSSRFHSSASYSDFLLSLLRGCSDFLDLFAGTSCESYRGGKGNSYCHSRSNRIRQPVKGLCRWPYLSRKPRHGMVSMPPGAQSHGGVHTVPCTGSPSPRGTQLPRWSMLMRPKCTLCVEEAELGLPTM